MLPLLCCMQTLHLPDFPQLKPSTSLFSSCCRPSSVGPDSGHPTWEPARYCARCTVLVPGLGPVPVVRVGQSWFTPFFGTCPGGLGPDLSLFFGFFHCFELFPELGLGVLGVG
ncbi:unnamed protein product [Cuscuta epithymum]|uniref:Uncharacterized protein n=1 Tax=Cuscuta epithymum TaxID=186058 RepID=A0AAV0D9H2_9ASTE|nr:unnamed protein product [Cuscuta epithymum]